MTFYQWLIQIKNYTPDDADKYTSAFFPDYEDSPYWDEYSQYAQTQTPEIKLHALSQFRKSKKIQWHTPWICANCEKENHISNNSCVCGNSKRKEKSKG